MSYLKEFTMPSLAKKLLDNVKNEENEITIMEVCGTHTMAVFNSGIKGLLPQNINLISGPGCPVCVTPPSYIDSVIELCSRDKVIITTFGDMIKVPGTRSSLKLEKALGKDIRVVYSSLDALTIAEQNPFQEVVFLGIGFETTAPLIALAIKKAQKKSITNFSVLTAVKTMPNALKKLMLDKEVNLDGFLLPGHVSAVIGSKSFAFLAEKFQIPAVVAGFTCCDITAAILLLARMIRKREYKILNLYQRVVKDEGNKKALALMNEVFFITESTWRGLGSIEATGLEIREKYKSFDAKFKFNIKNVESEKPKACLCGEILRGVKKPLQCKLFAKECTPSNPIGACMISQEGTCAAYYQRYAHGTDKFQQR